MNTIAINLLPTRVTIGQTFDVIANLYVLKTEWDISMKKAVGFCNIAILNYVVSIFSSKFIRNAGNNQS